LLYVERGTGRLILAGEFTFDSNLVPNEHEAVELWQSPRKLRESLRIDLIQESVADMREHKGPDWSTSTVARAVLKSGWAATKSTHEQTLEKIMEHWKKAPISTSVVIVFWQRYLVKLSGVVESKKCPGHTVEPAELVMRWMPLKADRVLPGDLLSTLRSVGWVFMSQMPRIFQPMVCHAPPPAMLQPTLRTPKLPAKRDESRESLCFEESHMLESKAVTLMC